MSTTVKLKRGSGSDPSASDMVVGEPVIRTDTAELFFKKDDGSVAKVSGGGGGPDFKYLALRNAANDGSASYPGNDFTLVTSGTTTAVSPAAANTLLVSYGGVIQKPNSGTSTSGITGFIVDGSRIKTATNFAAAPDFILYQEAGGIGEPSDDTVTNAKVTSNAAIAGTKISPNFGSQNIVTTGTLGSGDLTLSGANPIINFTDTNNDSDFRIQVEAGTFLIEDTTNSYADRFRIASDGTVDVFQNLNVGAGLDVTGSLTVVQSASTNSAHIKMGTSTNQNTHLELENDGSADIRFGCFGSSANTFGNITANNGFIHTTNDLSINAASDTGSVKIGIGATPSTKLFIHSNGKCGIGTDSPTRYLHVKETSGGDAQIIVETTANAERAQIEFKSPHGNWVTGTYGGNTTGDWLTYTAGDHDAIFHQNGYERFRIKSNGKVGINNNNPSFPLHITNTSSTFNSAALIRGDNATAGQGSYATFTNTNSSKSAYFGLDGAGFFNKVAGAALIGTSGSDPILFATNGNTERVRIDSNGQLVLSNGNMSTAYGNSICGGTNLELDTQGVIKFRTHTNQKASITDNGLCFGYDSAAANALSDYESGDWTPAVSGSSNKSVSAIESAKYVKIGCFVHCQCYISLTGTGNSNAFKLGGLPFTNRGNGYNTNVADFGKGGIKGAYTRVNSSQSYAEFLYSSENINNDRITLKGNQVGTGYLITTISYMTDS